MLYQAFGYNPPEFIHVPLVVGADGLRLAKRHGDTTLRGLRQAGYTAPEVLHWLATVSGMAGDDPFSPQREAADLIPIWDLSRLGKKQVVWEGPGCLQMK